MVRMLKVCFARILFACEFDASLDLADGHAGEMEIDVIGALQPSEHSAMGPWPAQFRHHIGIEQEGHALELHHSPAAGCTTRWHEHFCAGFRS